MAEKIRVGVVFGGRSAEHEVSIVSAASIIGALDRSKYEILPIGITPAGSWMSGPEAIETLRSKSSVPPGTESLLLPDPGRRGALFPAGGVVDVFFPVVHGKYGEDGCIQGLFELAGIPYVGAGVLASSAGMDKIVAKQLCEQSGLPVAPYVWFTDDEFVVSSRSVIRRIERTLKYPCFVKPSNSGSSVGISKAKDRKELETAIRLAAEYDRRILVEKSVERAREIEVSVLGNEDPSASVPGEIISSNEFYDYDAKYVDGKSESVIPAKLPASVAKRIRTLAVAAFRAIDCAGMARVDFLVKKRSNAVVLNEINTLPGFTSISMYPKLWEATGIPYSTLLDRLILLAIERHEKNARLLTAFKPKTDWYRG